MSYCRWSSLNYQCDIYAYESEDGYYIHIARLRKMGPQRYLPWQEWIDKEISTEEFFDIYEKFNKELDNSPNVEIGLPFDGETIRCQDEEDFYDTMAKLKEVGYYFPDNVLDMIAEEMEL